MATQREFINDCLSRAHEYTVKNSTAKPKIKEIAFGIMLEYLLERGPPEGGFDPEPTPKEQKS